MHTIGIDLSVKGEHNAVIVDETGHFVSPLLHFRTEPGSMTRLLAVAQEENADGQLQAVMEPTGMAWFPVAVFADLFCRAARWFREHWYAPQRVSQAGAETIRQAWLKSGLDLVDCGAWVSYLVPLAEKTLSIYGAEASYLDYELLQVEAVREQTYLAFVEELHHRLLLKTVRPLYRQLHPSRHLESIPGVGQDGAAVYVSFIGNPKRFGSLRQLRGWSGMVPNRPGS